MKAKVIKVDSHQHYSARTENNILLVFSVKENEQLEIGDEIDVELQEILEVKTITRVSDDKKILITIRENDIHDLNKPIEHGGQRVPSKDRMSSI